MARNVVPSDDGMSPDQYETRGDGSPSPDYGTAPAGQGNPSPGRSADQRNPPAGQGNPPPGHPADQGHTPATPPTAPAGVPPGGGQNPPSTGAPPAGPDPEAPIGSFTRFITWGIVIAYLAAAAVMLISGTLARASGKTVLGLSQGRLLAIGFGIGIVAICLLIVQSLGQTGSRKGIFRPIIGGDGRFSTSLTQLGLWTLAAGTGFAFLLGRAMFEGAPLGKVLPAGTWDDYLILLGGPFAAAVLAKGVVSYKLDAGTLQKSEPARPELSQIATNDQGSADLVDNQYLLFNIIALGYFVIQICATAVLPTIPPTLLAMTSGTAALYVANKAAQRNAPLITSVTPNSAAPGERVTVLGANFDPADQNDERRRITLSVSGVDQTIYSNDSSDTRFVFQVPAATPPGKRTMKITSSAGVETEAHDLEILSKDVVITGSDPSELRPGSRMCLYGRNMRADIQPRVEVAGLLATGAVDVSEDGTKLFFTAPNALPNADQNTALVTVSFEGRGDASHTMAVDQPRVRSAWRTANPSTIHVSAVGLRGPASNGYTPTLIINGLSVPLTRAWDAARNTPLEGELPQPMAAEELRIQVVDDLGRKSSDYVLAKLPGV